MPLTTQQQDVAFKALDAFAIELPSWGFANTGTRFGKFIQASAATTTAEKIADAGQVHKVTGCCPTIATHVLWDYPNGVADVESLDACAKKHGIRIGAINPNLFQDQCYKWGSVTNRDPAIRARAGSGRVYEIVASVASSSGVLRR